uniref:NADH-ubiquinone oxidoreductase chain 2 n=1 Tax=Longitarsus nigrofasciatus TaxID=1425583 RepID=A0A1P8NMX4_9CUCU|nr:NADH dehydrogenase subunit 2 [Longitarsus nigrofasciatus]
MLFFKTLIIGTLISISSYNWFMMWIGLEINLMSIIPLFKSQTNSFPTEATLKYFITQALASTIILFSMISSMNLTEFFFNYNYSLMMILNSALLTKLGAAPFHFWFPEVMEGLNWLNSLMLLTWQKLAPMILLMYNLNMTIFFSMIIILSSIISGIYGINQVSLRKILSYSSINHIAWMLASMLNMKNIWLIYFSIYSIISINIILIFYYFNIFFISQLFLFLNKNKMIKLLFIFNFYSLGGLPPFLGFFPKWLVINNLTENNFYSMSMILILSTLITLFYYIRLTLPSLTLNYEEFFIYNQNKNKFKIIIFNMISIFSLFMCSSIFSYF